MRDDDCAYKKMKRDQKNRRWATGQSISHSLINLVPKEKKENLFLIFPYSFSFLLPAPVQLRTTIEHIRARLYLYVNTNAEAHFNTRSAIHTHRDNEMQSNHRPCSTDLIEKKNVHSRCVRRAYNTEEKKKKGFHLRIIVQADPQQHFSCLVCIGAWNPRRRRPFFYFFSRLTKILKS